LGEKEQTKATFESVSQSRERVGEEGCDSGESFIGQEGKTIKGARKPPQV